MSFDTAPTVTTWADGYGTWHALVPLPTEKAPYASNPYKGARQRAREAISREIEARMPLHEAIAYDGPDIERAPEYDTETHIAYKETGE